GDPFAVGGPDGEDGTGHDERHDGRQNQVGEYRQHARRPFSDPRGLSERRSLERKAVNECSGPGRNNGPALPCAVVDEPASAGGTSQKPRASGFPATEACTPRGVATHLGRTLAQTSLPPSRAKQGTSNAQ